MKTEQEWNQAKAHLDEVISEYRSLQGMPGVNVNFALTFVLNPLLNRFKSGEQTDELHESIMNAE